MENNSNKWKGNDVSLSECIENYGMVYTYDGNNFNGWIADEDGRVFIYYASSDTRMHVATSDIDRLVDYCMNTESDGFRTGLTVERLNRLIDKNIKKK